MWLCSKVTLSKGRFDEFVIRQNNHQLISHLEREYFPEILRIVKKLEVEFFLYFGNHSKNWVAARSRWQAFVVFDKIADLIQENDTNEESKGSRRVDEFNFFTD